MTTSSLLMTSQINSSVNLQAMATFVTNLLAAGGWIQTLDSGQTPANSLVYSAGASSGFQIWRMNDALQSTYPVFVKFEFGTSVANYGGYWITIGTGSDGSGNITGIIGARIAMSGGWYASQTTSYGSCASNRFCVWMFRVTTAYSGGPAISIERSKDANGADTGDGIIYMSWNNATGSSAYYNTQFLPFSGTVRAIQTGLIVPVPPSTTSMAAGSVVGLMPIIPFGATGMQNPGNNFICYYQSDLAALNPIPVVIHGVTRTYIPMDAASNVVNSANWPTSYLCMLYE